MNEDCLKEEKIWEYIDGELEMSEYCKTRSHLEKCPDCKAKFQEIRSLNSSLLVGFEHELFDCGNSIQHKSASFDNCVSCPTYSRKWAKLWSMLLFSNVAAFCSAFMILVFFSPNIEGLSCILELDMFRQSLVSLLHL